jgi:hypothetical protein
MLTQKTLTISMLLPIWLFFGLSCGLGEDEGTLELDIIANGGTTQITQAQVRLDTQNEGIFALNGEMPTFKLSEGGHILAVDFLDKEGRRIVSYPPKVVAIEAGKSTRISIELPDPPEKVVARFIAVGVPFRTTKPGEIEFQSRDLIIERGSIGVTEGGTVTITYLDGSGVEEFIGSSRYENSVTTLKLDIEATATYEDGTRVYQGHATGRFSIFDREGKEIFNGKYETEPRFAQQVVLNPQGVTIKFNHQVASDGVGVGAFEGHIFKGTAVVELRGVENPDGSGGIFEFDVEADILRAL